MLRKRHGKESGPVARHRGGASDQLEVVNVIVQLICGALDAFADFIETHVWAGVLLMTLIAFAVSTADSWFA